MDKQAALRKSPVAGRGEKVSDLECVDKASDKEVTFYGVQQPSKRSASGQVLKDMFLPAGYPDTVSRDYTSYQIYNALQAFCSSLASLLSSRAVLQGFGVGDASASATHAMLLSVLQDVCSRFATIFSAWYIGTSLWPEAKSFRLLADVFNDLGIILDILSPVFASPVTHARLPEGMGWSLRVAGLCLSGSMKALCGVCAGGSKAAITLHFATAGKMSGDVGDLNAKDGSKETVLALLGTLCGTLMIPHLTTSQATYMVLFVLLACHLGANYLAVRRLAIRSLNRQRLTLAWTLFSSAHAADETPSTLAIDVWLTPELVSSLERLFHYPETLRDAVSDRPLGRCSIVSSPSDLLPSSSLIRKPNPDTLVASVDEGTHRILDLFSDAKFFLWLRAPTARRGQPVHILLTLKPGYAPRDLLEAWVTATELARLWCARPADPLVPRQAARVEVVRAARERVRSLFPRFLDSLGAAGWQVDEGLLVPGTPQPLQTSTGALEPPAAPSGENTENRKRL